MDAVVFSSRINGSLLAPRSKSATQRACALSLLNQGITQIWTPGYSRDDQVAIELVKAMGAAVHVHADRLEIISSGKPVPQLNLHAGESGLSARMFTPIAAMSEKPCVLTGEGSLLSRPMHFFNDVLPLLGVRFDSQDGYLPFHIQGPLRPANIEIDGSASSQYLTGLLFALAASTEEQVIITVKDLVSRPYIDLSLDIMKNFGYRIEQEAYRRFVIYPRARKDRNIDFHVEADWSQAAMLLVAAATAGESVTIQGLDMNSTQADKAILSVLSDAFAQYVIREGEVIVEGGQPLEAFRFDATHCPDLFPPLVALAAACRGTSYIEGAGRLVHKESNRAESLIDVFSKLGVSIQQSGNTLAVTGQESVNGGTVSSHHDHRIAMAATIAGLRSEKGVRICHAESVGKSYAEFFLDLQSLGAGIQLEE